MDAMCYRGSLNSDNKKAIFLLLDIQKDSVVELWKDVSISNKWFGILLWLSNKFVGKLYFSCKKRWQNIDAGRQKVVRNWAIIRALLVYVRTCVTLLFVDAFHCINPVPKSRILESRWAKQLTASVGFQLPCVIWEKTLCNLVVSQKATANVVLQEHGLGTNVSLKHYDWLVTPSQLLKGLKCEPK